MTTSGSQRIAGTDGSDFQYRERVAVHYGDIAETKPHLRLLIYAHILLALPVITQLLAYHLPFISTMTIPKPHLWQYIWLISIIPSLCGLISMNRNQVTLMKLFFGGTITFGLGTIMTTIIFNLDDLLAYRRMKINQQLSTNESQTFFGYPLLILWYIFLFITVQIHIYSLYLSNVLLKSWQQYRTVRQR